MTAIDALLRRRSWCSPRRACSPRCALYQVRAQPPPNPELVRKLFHIGGGVTRPVAAVAVRHDAPVLPGRGADGMFAALRLVGRLRRGVGRCCSGGARTAGEFCYLASMALLFWLSDGDRLLYSVPLLMLALGDTFAALVGKQYGKLPLRMAATRKSYEGAAAFFLTAFFCVHVPVLLSGATGRLESLLVAAGVGLIVMMAEAAAWWGLDNLVIPLRLHAAQGAARAGRRRSSPPTSPSCSRSRCSCASGGGAPTWATTRCSARPLGLRRLGGRRLALGARAADAPGPPRCRCGPGRERADHRFPVVLAYVAAFVLAARVPAVGRSGLILPFAACFGADLPDPGADASRGAGAGNEHGRDAVSIATARGMLVVVNPVVVLSVRIPTLAALTSTSQAASSRSTRPPPWVRAPAAGLGARALRCVPRWARQVVIVAATFLPLAIGIHYGTLPST